MDDECTRGHCRNNDGAEPEVDVLQRITVKVHLSIKADDRILEGRFPSLTQGLLQHGIIGMPQS